MAKSSVDKIYTDTKMDDFSDDTIRIRRNLIFISAIAIFLCLHNALDVEENTINIIGLHLKVTKEDIFLAIFFVLTYNLLHFIVNTYNHFIHSLIRLSGVIGNYNADRYVEPKGSVHSHSLEGGSYRSNLYYWFSSKSKTISYDLEKLKNAIEVLEVVDNELIKLEKEINVGDIRTDIKKIRDSLLDVNGPSEALLQIVTDEQLKKRLKKFNDSFWNFQIAQVARMIIVEFGFPVIFALYSIYLISKNISLF